jgi:HEAT repeat protein
VAHDPIGDIGVCMCMTFRKIGFGLVAAGLAVAATSAQQAPRPRTPAPTTPGAMSIEERTLVAQGWALLAQGLFDEAATRAAKALAASPRNPSALVLAVEVAVTRGGAQAGLSEYERWLGQRTMEEPALVRRIALALLREAASQSEHMTARLEALRVLAVDGDAAAAAELAAAANTGGTAERRVLASIGNERALNALIADLNNGTGNATSIIDALARSGSKSAIAPLSDRLQNPSPEIRGAAVEGLGKLGSSLGSFDLITRIKPLLADKTSYVRVRAAGALYGLNDMSGLQILQDLLQAEPSAGRLIALQAMASRPDAVWLEQARRLASAAEPEVRVGAARLLGPHDPELARKVLQGVMSDPNPAIREMASDAFGDVYTTDFPALRQLMKSNDRLTGVRAAGRLLTLALR